MNLIESFSVDHTRIIPGIFISRIDNVRDEVITTYDVRFKKPNVEPAMTVAAMHSLEHIIATFLRNDPQWKDKIIYWGPMGCLTGFYLILKGNYASADVCNLLIDALYDVERSEAVPGATPESCGSYLLHDLAGAKLYAADFRHYLIHNIGNAEIFEYPKSNRIRTSDDRAFYDS